MTVDNVKALSPFGTVQGSRAVAGAEEAVQERFDKLMTKAGDQIAAAKQPKSGSTAAQTPKQMMPERAKDTIQPKDTAVQNTDKAAVSEKPDNAKVSADDAKNAAAQGGEGKTAEAQDTTAQDAAVQETVEEAAKELAEEVADVMDVPLEKVEEAMEILGLTAVDLFDVSNLRQLLLNLADGTDELALVTDETLYGNLQELFGTVQEALGDLQEELGLSAEELEALLAQVSAEEKASVETEEPLLQLEQEPEVSVEGMKDYAVSVQKDGGTVQVKVTVDDASGEKQVSEQVTDAAKPETEPVKKSDASDIGQKNENGAAGENAANAFLQNLTNRTEEAQAPAEQPVYTQPETNQIMDQIMEYMKVQIKPETQELEMQLHPASLGTVHVQLAAKDGAITAQFTAQNETVKAVLETQMIQLKEQFEEQGIKVEAVEVTVANHAYGEQYGGEQEAQNQENNSSKKGAKRISLNLDELEEEGLESLDESERIAVEMMQANGSTVNYMA